MALKNLLSARPPVLILLPPFSSDFESLRHSFVECLQACVGCPLPRWKGVGNHLARLGCFLSANRRFSAESVLSAARVKENCFSLSFIAAPTCETWRRVSINNKYRVFGGFAPSPEAWTGGSGRAARQCASSSAFGGQTGPVEAGTGHKPAFKPAWKTTGLSRLAHSSNPGWGPRRHRVRTEQVSVLTIHTMPTTAFAAALPAQRVAAKSVKSED